MEQSRKWMSSVKKEKQAENSWKKICGSHFKVHEQREGSVRNNKEGFEVGLDRRVKNKKK